MSHFLRKPTINIFHTYRKEKTTYLLLIVCFLLFHTQSIGQSILVSFGLNSDLYSKKAPSLPILNRQENFISWNFRVGYEHSHKLGAWLFALDLSPQRAGKNYKEEQFDFGFRKMSHNNAFAVQLSTYWLWKTDQTKKCVFSAGAGFGFKYIPSRDIATLNESIFVISPTERYEIHYENRGLRNFNFPLLLQASFDYKFNARLTFSASIHYQTGFWKNYIAHSKIVHTNNLEVTEKHVTIYNNSAKWNVLFGVKFTVKSKQNDSQSN